MEGDKMFKAMEEVDRQNRQQKYLIAQYEDKIADYQKKLTEAREANVQLERQALEAEVKAKTVDASYESKKREKEKLVFQYEELAKEMQEVQERLVFLEAQKKETKDRYKTRLEEAAKVDEQWMEEYMKDPKCKERMEKKKRLKETKEALTKQMALLEERKGALDAITSKYPQIWTEFEKNCVKLAEVHLAYSKQREIHANLKAELDKLSAGTSLLKSPNRIPLMSQPGLLRTPLRSSFGAWRTDLSLLARKDGFTSKPREAAPVKTQSEAFRKLGLLVNSPRQRMAFADHPLPDMPTTCVSMQNKDSYTTPVSLETSSHSKRNPQASTVPVVCPSKPITNSTPVPDEERPDGSHSQEPCPEIQFISSTSNRTEEPFRQPKKARQEFSEQVPAIGTVTASQESTQSHPENAVSSQMSQSNVQNDDAVFRVPLAPAPRHVHSNSSVGVASSKGGQQSTGEGHSETPVVGNGRAKESAPNPEFDFGLPSTSQPFTGIGFNLFGDSNSNSDGTGRSGESGGFDFFDGGFGGNGDAGDGSKSPPFSFF